MTEPDRYCPSCATLVEVEQPPCAEDHDGDCPEWACTLCGAALLGEPGEVVPAVRVERRGTGRAQHRTHRRTHRARSSRSRVA